MIAGGSITAQISPGDLTNAHKDLEGISNCTKCHELGKAVLNSKCLDCHTEIADPLSQNKGYHAFSTVNNKNCFEHSHALFTDFNIVRSRLETFGTRSPEKTSRKSNIYSS